ncbi:IS600 ORF2 [Shigella sonnei]|nr:IS600 ORF2 [Shigella sonnei]
MSRKTQRYSKEFKVFGVSRSGYYNWVQHEPSDRKQKKVA